MGGVDNVRYAPAALSMGKSAGAHRTGGWLGVAAGQNDCGKISHPPPEFEIVPSSP